MAPVRESRKRRQNQNPQLKSQSPRSHPEKARQAKTFVKEIFSTMTMMMNHEQNI